MCYCFYENYHTKDYDTIVDDLFYHGVHLIWLCWYLKSLHRYVPLSLSRVLLIRHSWSFGSHPHRKQKSDGRVIILGHPATFMIRNMIVVIEMPNTNDQTPNMISSWVSPLNCVMEFHLPCVWSFRAYCLPASYSSSDMHEHMSSAPGWKNGNDLTSSLLYK